MHSLKIVITYDFSNSINNLRTYAIALVPASVTADTADTGPVLTVPATAPTGTSLAGSTTTVRVTADLSVTLTDAPDPVTVGQPLTYTATMRNNGPGNAADVRLTGTLPAGVAFVSATVPSGTCTLASGTVTCTRAALANAATAAASIVVTPAAAGALAFSVNVTATEPDNNVANNTASAQTTVAATPPPVNNGTLAFAAATATIGESAGTVVLTVARSSGTDGAVSVNYATANGTATAGSDYTAANGHHCLDQRRHGRRA
jgi:uncharacterized repeat protein (TIGR01451 family)